MRTTINLDEGLLAQLKERASASDSSVSKLVEQAVRLFIRTPQGPEGEAPFELVTFGAGGHFSKHNIDKTSALLEAEDADRFGVHR